MLAQPEQDAWKQDVLAGRIALEELDTEPYDLYAHQNEDIVRLTPEQLKQRMAEKERMAAASDARRGEGDCAMRQMVMVGFLQAQNCTNLVSSWRHPESRDDCTSADYYQTIGRVLEDGKFHVGFFDDRLAMPDRYGNDHRHTVEHGIRCVKMDPVTVLTVMGMATKRLGLGATCSTTYFEPFHVARIFATLDLMTDGRAAWNVVTSMNDGEALNMGHGEHIEHDSRYDRADEFMEVVLGHWNSWDDDAIVHRQADRICSRIPTRCGGWIMSGSGSSSRGPFTVPRSPQGQPVVIQAGQSGRGKQFSARWGELIFVSTHTSMEHGRQIYQDLKEDSRPPTAAIRTMTRSRRRPMSSPPKPKRKPKTRWR